ncbi:DUF3231 family protein [Paenibacillus sp. BSR1-1]|uniref:DUF3231 family protein n=1 Tax=Paenibacillus sp. BSR1-1 TaxID=3020845 RepID=UPI0025B1BACD|nr:DUF3231 family protein [Paenibacillus sp. BSR1-1]MDN3015685.1 DUF3231 family protein [Paenibacillus sp. BSR1-1]
MDTTLKPINLSSDKLNSGAPLTSVEMAKLWATYMGNSMSKRILTYYLKHVEDQDIKTLLENGLKLASEFMKEAERIFNSENFPIPVGFTEKDVNLESPRLYQDEFYVHYLKYAAKAGLSLYAVAVPLVMRKDTREFFYECTLATSKFLEQLNITLISKGFILKPPVLPVPEKVDFIEKQNYLKGFMGDIRPLHALEVTHLYDNIENNSTSKALLLGFHQVVRNNKVKQLFKKGLDITEKSLKQFSEKLTVDNLPAPTRLDHLVTDSLISPFSDKIMLFHKVDMFSMKIRAFANSIAVNGRRDIALMYGRNIVNVFAFVEDGAQILIKHGWMEQPPKAIDRVHLAAE